MIEPKVSFIYVNFNSSKLLEEALTSVQNAAPSVPYEIIVVDDASTDNSVEVVRTKFPYVHLIVNAEELWGLKSANIGVKASLGKYVYYLGTDTVLFKGTLEKLVRFLDENKDAGAVAGRLFFPDGGFQRASNRVPNLEHAFMNFTFLGHIVPKWKQKLQDHYTYKGMNWDENHEVEVAANNNMLVRRSVLDSIGLLDERLTGYFAESDLCVSMRRKGWKVYYLAEGKVIHYLRGTVSKSNIDQIARNCEKDCYQYFKKHYGLGPALLLKIFILISNFLFSVKTLKPNRVFTTFFISPKEPDQKKLPTENSVNVKE